MCHFHSVVVTGDGRILHLPSNSHSDIVRHHGLGVDLAAKWWECEWSGCGEMPSRLVQDRGKITPPTGPAQRAAERHYRKLAQIVSGDIDPSETFPFDQPEYSDVRAVYKQASAPKLVGPIAEMFNGLDDATAVAIVQELVETLSLDMAEIAADEIERAIENDETRYDAGYEAGTEAASAELYSADYVQEEYARGYDAGVKAASEDMYTSDRVQEECERAVKEAKEEWENDELDAARQEGFEEGYFACKQGKPLPAGYVNGMPSFLF